jgi:preprotein translocase subunit SecG
MEVIMLFSLAASGTVVAQYVIGSLMMLIAVALVFMILKQTGKEQGLSGTLSGNTETYFGKAGGNDRDKLLFRLTVAFSVIFVVLTVVLLILTM